MSNQKINSENNHIDIEVMGKKFKLSSYDATFSNPSIHDNEFVVWTIDSTLRIEDNDYFKDVENRSIFVCRFRNEAEKIHILSGVYEPYAYELSLDSEGTKVINEISEFIKEEAQIENQRFDSESLSLEILDRQADILYFCQYKAIRPYLPHLSKETTELFLQTASPDEKDEALWELAKIGSRDCVERFLQAGVEVPLRTVQQSHENTKDVLRSAYEHRLLKRHLAENPPSPALTQQQSQRRRL